MPISASDGPTKLPATGTACRDVAHDGDRDQVCAADAAVRRIEGDPARPRHIDLCPGVGRAGADSSEASRTGILEIPRDDPCPEPQAARSVGEEHRKVPARPPAATERLERRLRPLLLTVLVQDRVGDGRTEILQQGQCVRRGPAHDTAHPCGKSSVRVLILLDRQRSEIGPFVGGILEGVDDGGGGDIEDRPGCGVELDLCDALDHQHVMHRLEGRRGDSISPDVMRPGHLRWGRHHQLELDQPQVPAFARTQHQAVRAEGDRLAVAICRTVVDPETNHTQSFGAVRSRRAGRSGNVVAEEAGCGSG